MTSVASVTWVSGELGYFGSSGDLRGFNGLHMWYGERPWDICIVDWHAPIRYGKRQAKAIVYNRTVIINSSLHSIVFTFAYGAITSVTGQALGYWPTYHGLRLAHGLTAGISCKEGEALGIHSGLAIL